MIRDYLERYLKETNRSDDAGKIESFCFGMDAQTARREAERVLRGERTARSYPANGYRRQMFGEPRLGQLAVITDWEGRPLCIVETTSVKKQALSDIDGNFCLMENGNQDVNAWREANAPIFKAEVEEIGGSFDESTEIFCETFRVVKL